MRLRRSIFGSGFAVSLGLVLVLGNAGRLARAQSDQAAKADPIQQRKDQLAADSAQLLKLATELKAAVDKTTKDQLSVPVVLKAAEVERLARKVREEMKATSVSAAK